MKLFSLLPKRRIHLTCNSPGIRHGNVHPMEEEKDSGWDRCPPRNPETTEQPLAHGKPLEGADGS